MSTVFSSNDEISEEVVWEDKREGGDGAGRRGWRTARLGVGGKEHWALVWIPAERVLTKLRELKRLRV